MDPESLSGLPPALGAFSNEVGPARRCHFHQNDKPEKCARDLDDLRQLMFSQARRVFVAGLFTQPWPTADEYLLEGAGAQPAPIAASSQTCLVLFRGALPEYQRIDGIFDI